VHYSVRNGVRDGIVEVKGRAAAKLPSELRQIRRGALDRPGIADAAAHFKP
jgi:hypothetical protein